MKLAYMYATPDVVHSEVTAIQGDVDFCFELIKQTGYTGVELLLANPKEVSVPTIAQAAANSGLDIPALCTGEVYGQDGLSFADPDPKKRQQAIDRMKYAMDIGGYFNAPVNVGRLRGRYQKNIEKEQTLDWIRQALIQCAEE